MFINRAMSKSPLKPLTYSYSQLGNNRLFGAQPDKEMPFMLFKREFQNGNGEDHANTSQNGMTEEFKSPQIFRSPRVLFPVKKGEEKDSDMIQMTKSRDTSLVKRTFNEFSSNKN
jgi:hypothetical protein